MALILSAATGNFNAGATWVGGIVPSAADEARASTGHTVTITADVTCAELSNAGTGIFTLNNGVTLTANVTNKSSTGVRHCLQFTDASPAVGFIVGNVTGSALSNGSFGAQNSSTGTLTITGTVTGGPGTGSGSVNNASTGTITITGSVTGGQNSGNSFGAQNSSTGTLTITGTVTAGTAAGSFGVSNTSTGPVTIIGNVTAGAASGVSNTSTGTLTITGDCTASTSANAVNSTTATPRVSGSFISASNGRLAVNASAIILLTTPIAARTRYALNGVGTYVDMFTTDNSFGQANPTDVRSGVSYASGNLTGSLTVPARGSVALSVAYGPSMPFTATRSGTTATATLAYSYPFVVGDQITVTGASNTAWNNTYTIASVVSGTSVTFVVPATHSATAGTGALMQTTGTAVLDPAAVASAVWGAASRTITGGLVDTATTLTNAPIVPSVVQIRTEMDSNSTKLANLDTTVSSRLASSAYSAAPTTAQIATAVEGSLLNEADGQAVLNAIVGAIGNTNLSEVSIVAAVRADLERVGGKIDSIPTTAAPTAAANASAVWATASKTITGGTVDTLTNSPDVPTEAEIASQVRTELSVELGRIDAAVSSRLAPSGTLATVTTLTNAPTVPTPAQIATQVRTELATELARVDVATSTRLASSAYTAPANSDVTAIKAKTDLLETTRLAQCSTVATTGAQLAAALS